MDQPVAGSPDLLTVEDLAVNFRLIDGVLHAVDGISFAIGSGEAVGLVGESGSGKSVAALAVMGLLEQPPAEVSGHIRLQQQELVGMPRPRLRRVRGELVSMVFQEPMTSLNPVMTVGDQIGEAIAAHRQIPRQQVRQQTLELLDAVGIGGSARRLRQYPHQLSGGMRQRIMIAIALAAHPHLLIADEPTTALDATVQAQILALISGLQRDSGMSLLLISHDLAVVAEVVQRVIVMYAGRIVEEGPVHQILHDPQHPYTRALLHSMPRSGHKGRLAAIHGHLPDLLAPPQGCRFAVRCPDSLPICHDQNPPLVGLGANRSAACFLHNGSTPAPATRLEATDDDGHVQTHLSEAARKPGLDRSQLAAPERPPVLVVDQLVKHFPAATGVFGDRGKVIRAVDGVSIRVGHRETVSVVGETGCGKSTLGRTVLYLVRPTSGTVFLYGECLGEMSPRELRSRRSRMQIIFQDPYSSLNPRMPVFDIIGEGLAAQGMSRADRIERIQDALETVGLSREHIRRYPHEFSGGQRQRLGIARALALDPGFIVCDEAVSALDVSVQAQILNLLVDLREQRDLSYLFISHDLRVVNFISDRVAVMYLGRIVEEGRVEDIYARPAHPYTAALLSAAPEVEPESRRERILLKGDVPNPVDPPAGCRFHPRCWLREKLGSPDICAHEQPTQQTLANDHTVSCHFSDQLSEYVKGQREPYQSLTSVRSGRNAQKRARGSEC
jgi:peptide/nickel transport system ATP-binding protein